MTLPSQTFRFLPVAFMKCGWVSAFLCFKQKVVLLDHPSVEAASGKGSCADRSWFALTLVQGCAHIASWYLTGGGFGWAGNSGRHPKMNCTSKSVLLPTVLFQSSCAVLTSRCPLCSLSAALSTVLGRGGGVS